MIRKLFCAAALAAGLGVAMSAPAPAIDFICSCKLCTTSTSGLACRDLDHGGVGFTSCGAYHVKYCS
jgi:hypothetical protein